MALVDNRPASKEELIVIQNEIEEIQLGEFPALNDLEFRVDVLEGQVISISGDVAQEVLDRGEADSALGLEIDAVETALAQEVLDRGDADSALGLEIDAVETALAQEVIDRAAADVLLDGRIVPLEDINKFEKAVIYENNAAVVADGQPGVEDVNLRPGWYYQNLVPGQKINWYFFDGINQATIQKQNFSAYAVVTFDSVASLPIIAVYTIPTGINDIMPGFAHSRYIFSNFASVPVIGKKYLVYIGESPAIFPELPRIKINLTLSQGEQLPTEPVFTCSFGSNSGAAVANVKLQVEHLGISSPSYKGNAELRIRAASLKKLEDAQTAFSGYVSANDARVLQVEEDLAQEVLDRGNADSALSSRITSLENFGYDQVVYVSKSGSDSNTGKQHSPFLTIAAALNSITDASPTKRYVILLQAGAYTETSIVLKANVFIVGSGEKQATRVTGAVSLHSSFSGSADNRSGFGQLTLISACDFNWQTVTSAAGKLYFTQVAFNTTVNMYGHNNATAQAQFDSCLFFGNLTVSGINVGVFTNNVSFSNITLNQHPNGGMASVLVASGGSCNGTVSMVTSVNDFGRRSALFARSFWMGSVVVNGPSSYADVTDSSLPSAGPTVTNGGNVVYLNPAAANNKLSNLSFPTAVNVPITPATSSATNLGDWNKQWAWHFAYVHASSGTDCYMISYGPSFAADSVGRGVGIYADGAGLQSNVNGGDIALGTASVSGTGVRGKISLDGREIDVTSKKIVNVASGTVSTDAINKGQLDLAISGISSINYYRYVLQSADITAKQITLPGTPSEPLNVTMDVFGGIEQKSGSDFTIAGNILSWAGKDFEALAEAGDEIMIEYKT